MLSYVICSHLTEFQANHMERHSSEVIVSPQKHGRNSGHLALFHLLSIQVAQDFS